MKARKPYHIVRNERQMSVLTAASRQEIVDVLAEIGSVSVAEIASALGRPADALYFHLRALQRAGLVEQVGYRAHGKRREALFRTVSPELRLHYEPQSAVNRRAVTAIVSSMLRLGIRDFRSAFESSDVMVTGAHRELWALRKTARLSLADIANVNRKIIGLRAGMKARGKGRLYAITVLLTPIDRQRASKRPALKSPGKKKK